MKLFPPKIFFFIIEVPWSSFFKLLLYIHPSLYLHLSQTWAKKKKKKDCF